MTIKVYPSLMPGEPMETHAWSGTFAGWLESKGIDYQAHEVQPIGVTLNGEELPVEQWTEVEIAKEDDVEVRPLPHGGVFKGIANIIGKLFNAVFGWLFPRNGGDDYQSPAQGRQLEASEGKANRAKLGDVVPELAGRFIRYPDYLTPPRRHFVNRREQWLEFHACIGPGSYQINAADVKVGDTPFSSLGADGSYQLFGPGANLSAISTHEHWHTVDEVGGTSSGTAGLELSTEIGNRVNSDPAAYDFDGLSVVRSSGQFPPAWGALTTVSVEYPRPYAITTQTETIGGFPASISEFEGYFGHVDVTLNASVMIGPRGSETEYIVHSATALGSGVYKVRFMELTGSPPSLTPVVVPASPSETLMFGSSVARSIASMTETSLTLAGPGFETATVSGATVAHAGGRVYGEWTSEFVACPGNETSNTYEIDVFFPGGLAFINDDGSLSGRAVEVEIQYRDVAGGASTTIFKSYSDNTLDQIGVTERLTTPTMRAAFRVRRVSAEGTETSVRDTIHWYGLKSRLRTRTSYPNWTTMSVKLRSGGRLAAQSENQINVVATRILPTLQPDGSWAAEQPTRDISAFLRYIAQSIGYADGDLDMEELQRLHAIWTSRGETMDHVFDLTTVKEAMNTTLGAGMAELTIAHGLIKPVRDEPRTQFEAGYSPQNMTGPLRRTFRARRHDDPDGVEVEFTDSETWTQQTVICALPGSQRLKLEKVKLQGVTSRTRAWRIGMRRAREQRYRNWDYSFETEMDALNSEYLSYVPLLDDIPGYGQSALLEHVTSAGSNVILRVTEPVRWEEGQSHVVAYRRADGTLAGPWVATPGPDDYSIVAPIPAAERPTVSLKLELPHVYVGTVENWCFPALITDISPRGTERASVSAANYTDAIYADDDNSPPN
ncbi:sulfur carrier protein ThiS [Pusillimonas noertemannii]|uniref:Sulfur carrier protein ThiS n=1 Tax=Pusillimonas noertemannii TaxID=305977 RepID=A0A2U1CS32_9BURK|nr:MoaD/ThiS family protein [Pusillimonas noertemannii]PVY68669.1 sulfur carrier protein ThiS [Pusillimonas noertemannii]